MADHAHSFLFVAHRSKLIEYAASIVGLRDQEEDVARVKQS